MKSIAKIPKRMSVAVLVIVAFAMAGNTSQASLLFVNGFETGISGWDAFDSAYHPTRVPSETNGIPSAAGDYHAQSSSIGSAGNWGGYNYGAGNAVPTTFLEYSTSVDIYLDINGMWDNNTRFDFLSAINDSGGTFRRDYVFNAGFYDDSTGPAPDTDRFVISASNSAQPGSAYAKNPGMDPIAISTTGWYTFEHHFYGNAGVLAVDMSIYNASGGLVHAWMLSEPTDLIEEMGGNNMGWFAYNEFGVLAFDNTSLTVVPEPASLVLVMLGAALFAVRLRNRKHEVRRRCTAATG